MHSTNLFLLNTKISLLILKFSNYYSVYFQLFVIDYSISLMDSP